MCRQLEDEYMPRTLKKELMPKDSLSSRIYVFMELMVSGQRLDPIMSSLCNWVALSIIDFICFKKNN
uniref:Uncharacterized protein n=1 Tax=Setaria italica TaxID=4555 RepID=K3ZBK3_SETIT